MASLPIAHPSFLFWGLTGIFSATVLAEFLRAGIRPQAIIVPDRLPGRSITQLFPPSQTPIPLLHPAGLPDITQQGWEHQIPVYGLHKLDHALTRATLAEFQPEVAVVACFNRRIPDSLLSIPRSGFFNIHPSLLPAFRGPAPLFWLFRLGAAEAMGVTVHQLDSGLDTGPIAAQQPITFHDGISGREADQQCARVGAVLMKGVLVSLAGGNLTTRNQEPGDSFFPWPKSADFALDTSWSARRAFNFMRSTAEWQRPYPISIAGRQFQLRQAVAFTAQTPPWAVQQDSLHLQIRFRPGTLRATLW